MKAFAAALLLSFLALPLLSQTAGQTTDPRLWPEEQRAFLEGPGLLLEADQRAAFIALDEAGRTAFIQRFLDQEKDLREGVRRRSLLAAREFLSPQDARAQLLFLEGPPRDKTVIDCGAAFRPMEIWTYGQPPAARSLILYQASPGDPFRLWLPIDSKQALYTDREIARTISERAQSAAYRRVLELASCQPNVAGVLFFHLLDEPSLVGWQSGVRYVDGSPKTSLAAVHAAAGDAAAGRLDVHCGS